MTLQHVGERWYQPGIGRFIQRDPIGIGGGMNVYAYCQPTPLATVDPSGLAPFEWSWRDFTGTVGQWTAGGAVIGGVAGAQAGGVGAIPGAAAGAGVGVAAGAAAYTGQQICVWIYDNIAEALAEPGPPIQDDDWFPVWRRLTGAWPG